MPQRFHLFEAALPLLVAAVLLLGSVLFYPVSFYWPLGVGALVAAAVAYRRSYSVSALVRAARAGMGSTLIALSILALVAVLIGVWLSAGTVPTLIYYGLLFTSPRYLVPISFLLAMAVSMMLGTSIGTLSTLGVAIMGVAHGTGAPIPLVAGALLSGALFGDRSSPLSGSLNLNVAMTGTRLREMVGRLWRTGGPAVLISLLLYLVTGFALSPTAGASGGGLRASLAAAVIVSPWLLLPPLAVLGLSFARVPVKWALGFGIITGLIVAVAVAHQQPAQPLMAALLGHRANTGDPALDRILSGGGLLPMMNQVILILTAGALSGIMEATGMMALVLERLVAGIRRPLALVSVTMAISMGVACVAANQALAIIIPGRMLRGAYQRTGLPAELLSRSLADSGTLLAGLIPWNVMSVLAATALGVPSAAFAPYAFLAFVLPAVSLWVTYKEERCLPAGDALTLDRVAAGERL